MRHHLRKWTGKQTMIPRYKCSGYTAGFPVTYLSKPRLMTTQDFVCISTSGIDLHLNAISSILQWNLCIVDGPEDGIISKYTFCCRVITHGRILTTSRGNSIFFRYIRWSSHKEVSHFHKLRESCFVKNLSPKYVCGEALSPPTSSFKIMLGLPGRCWAGWVESFPFLRLRTPLSNGNEHLTTECPLSTNSCIILFAVEFNSP